MARAAADEQVAGDGVRTERDGEPCVNEGGMRHEVEHGEDHVGNEEGV